MELSNQLERAVAEYNSQQARYEIQAKQEFAKKGEAMVAETLEFFSNNELTPDSVFIHGGDENRYAIAKFTYLGQPIFFVVGRQSYNWYLRASKGVCPKCEKYAWGHKHWMSHNELSGIGSAILELQGDSILHECPVEAEERESATDPEPAIKADPTPAEKLAAAIDEMIQQRIAESKQHDF